MSKDMKIIFENYRVGSLIENKTLIERANFTEEEEKIFEHFQINEGFLQMGGDLLKGVKDFYNDIKEWGKEKTIDFVKKMGAAYIDFSKDLRSQGVYEKYQLYNEIGAIRLLLTKKHVGLALAIFGAIFKLAGGYAIEKIAKMPKLLEQVKTVFEAIKDGKIKGALRLLFGDVVELGDIIKKAIAFSADNKNAEVMANIGYNVPGLGNLESLEEIFKKNLGVIK